MESPTVRFGAMESYDWHVVVGPDASCLTFQCFPRDICLSYYYAI